ncbi:hypothetical protein [Novosphingobium lindaniclasticum]|uniref:Uncharacterized protein n=1 Tax=Novosphingobium lindaniclasticum LE124 TaxID=1096930 RepID=T0H4S1_9SPHN|nr:hypothetical protein [Novosphingobium lindaniclasticum]EQB07967.1 hypothetical protein L284_21845 [Novosphingobium lindaniclasticum LE124]
MSERDTPPAAGAQDINDLRFALAALAHDAGRVISSDHPAEPSTLAEVPGDVTSTLLTRAAGRRCCSPLRKAF